MDNLYSVYIIILSWNNYNDTRECLESLMNLSYGNFRIVLLDNGSSDNSLTKIKDWANNSGMHIVSYSRKEAENGGKTTHENKLSHINSKKQLALIENGENLGFAAGVNVGIQYALHSNADYVWLLNNDTIVKEDSLDKLINFLSANKSYSGVTPKIMKFDKPDEVWSMGCDFTFIGGLKRFGLKSIKDNENYSKGYLNVSFITNCASVYPVELFKEVGLFSEDSFHGEEDFDFSLRLKKYSYKLGCVKDAVVFHKNAQSVSWFSLIGKIYTEYLTRLLSIKKHYGSFYWILWIVIFSERILIKYLASLDLSFFEGLKLVRLLIYNSYKLDKINEKIFFDSLMIQESLKTKNVDSI